MVGTDGTIGVGIGGTDGIDGIDGVGIPVLAGIQVLVGITGMPDGVGIHGTIHTALQTGDMPMQDLEIPTSTT